MASVRHCLVYTAVLLFAGAMEAHAQVGAACRPTDLLAEHIRDHMIELVTTSDSADMALRDSLRLSAMPADSVSIVSDSTTCAAAAIAYAHTQEPDPNPTVFKVWVIRIGSGRYAIFNPERAYRGESRLFVVMIFDADFNFVRAFVS